MKTSLLNFNLPCLGGTVSAAMSFPLGSHDVMDAVSESS